MVFDSGYKAHDIDCELIVVLLTSYHVHVDVMSSYVHAKFNDN